MLDELNRRQPEPFVLSSIPDGFGPSDHSSFYGAAIPVLMLFTNTHAEYHRPEDDWELINREGLERVSAFAADIIGTVAGSASKEAMAVTLVEGAGNPHGGAMAADQDAPSSSGPGYGAYMGTIPDMTPQDFGVRITGVREESPAEKGRAAGRRRHRGVRREGDHRSLRLHLRPAGPQTRRRGHGRGPPGRGADEPYGRSRESVEPGELPARHPPHGSCVGHPTSAQELHLIHGLRP